MASLTIENYVKTIYQLCAKKDGKPATTGQIANALDVSPGTVTSMLKTLSASSMVTYTPYEGVQLTDSGRILALRIIRRHRLIELFLVQTLGLSWDEVHEEAENMEHAVSDLLIDRIDDYLGYPDSDPHGDPIPNSDGIVPSATSQCLSMCDANSSFRLVRVLDQSSDFLRYLSEVGLTLDSTGLVLSNRTEAGVLDIKLPAGERTIGREVADKLLVVDA